MTCDICRIEKAIYACSVCEFLLCVTCSELHRTSFKFVLFEQLKEPEEKKKPDA